MTPRRVWVTGGGGFIASYLGREAARGVPGWEVRLLQRSDLDLLDFRAVERACAAERPDVILHCAALSRTGDCERDPVLARRVNLEATRHLAGLAADRPFLLLSTDLVFDGERGGYAEDDAVNPRSVYGETKAEAEVEVLRNPRHTVVRTSLNAGRSPSGGRSFNEELRAAWAAGRTLSLFHDEYRCPIAAAVTARALWALAQLDRPGLYHLAGTERLSRLAIGELLGRRWPEVTPRVLPSSVRDFKGPPRSPDTSLRCERLQALLPFSLPRFSEWLENNPDEPV